MISKQCQNTDDKECGYNEEEDDVKTTHVGLGIADFLSTFIHTTMYADVDHFTSKALYSKNFDNYEAYTYIEMLWTCGM